MNARGQVYLWAAQRISAMLLAFCVCIHLITLIYAVRGGLSAAEILARTHASIGWGAFYAVFVLAVAVHTPIGLRAILAEWLGWRGAALQTVTVLVGLAIAGLGLRAVTAVIT